ncbi:MAG: hypothetical protein ACRDD1_10055, partial [Planctomycetia bacterium]
MTPGDPGSSPTASATTGASSVAPASQADFDAAVDSFRVVFLGSPQAGKSTLLCAWYHVLRQTCNLAPALGDVAAMQFLRDRWERLERDGVVDPTPPKQVLRAQFVGVHFTHRFLLTLCDYAGEDVLRNLDAHRAGKACEEAVVDDVLNSDWIVLVHDPGRLAAGSPADQLDDLWLTKLLPLLGPGLLQRTTVYLSRADRTPADRLDRAAALIESSLPSGADRPTVERGSSVVEREDGRVRLPKSDDPYSPHSFVNRIVSTLLTSHSRRDRRGPRTKANVGLWAMVALTVATLAVGVAGTPEAARLWRAMT